MKSIVVIFFYFGRFPDWFEIFFDSIARNSTIDFLFYTDCDFEKYKSRNVKFVKISYTDYLNKIKEKTKIEFHPDNPYKICDFRPLLGLIHYEEIKDYDFYGYADVDLIFGDVRSFYTTDILSKYDVLSTHAHTLSDHFILFKTCESNLNMFKLIGGWREKLASSSCVGIGEDFLFEAYKKNEKIENAKYFGFYKYLFKFKILKLYLKEQYTTPFTPIKWLDGSIYSNQPKEWYYINGKITNNRDLNKSFVYLHFMNFKSSKYRHDGSKAPWEKLIKINNVEKYTRDTKLIINENGIFEI